MISFRGYLSVRAAAEGRGAKRCNLRLIVPGSTRKEPVNVLIHDLSETGFMFATEADLQKDEVIVVDLPGRSGAEARVVWHSENLVGCEFVTPLKSAELSAILLQAQAAGEGAQQGGFEEIVVGIDPSLDDLAAWKANFEETKGAAGYQLVGFRQTPDRTIIAIVVKVN